MKTTKEMIEVMQAYLRGDDIEYVPIGEKNWIENEKPEWNWVACDYRVKPKQKFVPFDTAEEFLAAQREHGDGVVCIDDENVFSGYDVSITLNGHVFLHERSKSGEVINFYGNLLDLFEGFKMADGTPCGKEVGICQH